MHVHEYQAKLILQRYGIPTTPFVVVSHLDEVEKALIELGVDRAVVKVQVHAGGRGKAGGVKIGNSKQEIIDVVDHMLGMTLVTPQTGQEGIVVRQVILSPVIDFDKEYYLGATIDRERGQSVLIASPEGGVEIEELAANHPERIKVFQIHPGGILRGYQLADLAKFMGWTGSLEKQGKQIAQGLAKAFVETDALLLEINPLVRTVSGELVALDAKLTVEDNALYRQPQLAAFYDPTQITPNEARAKEFDLAYVALGGNIGCMVNGAGLAMATMDLIQHFGGAPANFLDVGGGASKEKVSEGFKIILSDPKVSAILVNIFGGIMNCVTLAAGIITAATELGVHVPLVVRMEGTNVEAGRKILEDSGLNIKIAKTLNEAAQQVVQAAKNKKV